MRATAAHAVWAAALVPEAVAFDAATRDVAAAQTRLLRALVARNATSAFGRDHDLARVRALDDLRHALPLADFDAHRSYVERIANGENDVLGRSPVRVLEPTSGSSAASKLIPVSDDLRRAFARGVAPWIVDLLGRDPRIATGPAYWSLSPALRPDARSAAGLPIGFDDDAAYLGAASHLLERAVLAVPKAVRRLADVEVFRYVTLLHLVGRAPLRLVSVWNPSFLTLLLDALPRHADALADDLAAGRCRPPDGVERPELALPPARTRAAALQRATSGATEEVARRLWPQLRLLSCWTDAHAATAATELARRVPHAHMQGKGLIATEAFVSLPLHAAAAPVLAVRCHVFEFLEPGGTTTRFAHELEVGDEVEVVVTSDVLYRYRLGDRVRVEGHYRRAPTLRFLGRAAPTSDRVGEKLHERHVREALSAACAASGAAPRFALVACDDGATPAAYRVYVEGCEAHHEAVLIAALDAELRANPYYAYARDLGQLGPLAAVHVRDGAAAFETAMVGRGQRRGDVKPVALSPYGDWGALFHASAPNAP
ncbi:MAG: GH3 auxin-responsive promoter family protein [Trueperaceae bacterium]